MQDLILLETAEQVLDPSALYMPPTLAQRRMGVLEPKRETLEQVIRHAPLRGFPRRDFTPPADFDATAASRAILERHFAPFFATVRSYGDFSPDLPKQEFDALLQPIVVKHERLGLQQKIIQFVPQKELFFKTRAAFAGLCEHELMRVDTFIPFEYLPDIFMAVPVWYGYGSKASDLTGRVLAPETAYFCGLVPGQRWADTFQMFNYRPRPFSAYAGDDIPLRALERLDCFRGLFDHLILMTPYLDQAGAEWDTLEPLPQCDPYVIGFITGFPYMFVLDRFSQSGIFPALCELTANTIEFLERNAARLSGFNKLRRTAWYSSNEAPHIFMRDRLGEYFQEHTKGVLAAFWEGGDETLFDWLKDRSALAPA